MSYFRRTRKINFGNLAEFNQDIGLSLPPVITDDAMSNVRLAAGRGPPIP